MTCDVSLVIPARNAASTIRETLDSVAAQTVCPGEVIVVCDRSDDETDEIVTGHPAVTRMLRGEARGPAGAVNLGARSAGRTWLALLDTDDLWPQQRIEGSLGLLESTTADAVVGMVRTFPDPSVPAELIDRIHYRKEPHRGLIPGGVFLRRDVFNALGGYDDRHPVAFFIDFWDRFTLAGHTHVMTDEIVLLRRIRPGTISHRTGAQKNVINADTLRAVHQAIQRRKTQPS